MYGQWFLKGERERNTRTRVPEEGDTSTSVQCGVVVDQRTSRLGVIFFVFFSASCSDVVKLSRTYFATSSQTGFCTHILLDICRKWPTVQTWRSPFWSSQRQSLSNGFPFLFFLTGLLFTCSRGRDGCPQVFLISQIADFSVRSDVQEDLLSNRNRVRELRWFQTVGIESPFMIFASDVVLSRRDVIRTTPWVYLSLSKECRTRRRQSCSR